MQNYFRLSLVSIVIYPAERNISRRGRPSPLGAIPQWSTATTRTEKETRLEKGKTENQKKRKKKKKKRKDDKWKRSKNKKKTKRGKEVCKQRRREMVDRLIFSPKKKGEKGLPFFFSFFVSFFFLSLCFCSCPFPEREEKPKKKRKKYTEEKKTNT